MRQQAKVVYAETVWMGKFLWGLIGFVLIILAGVLAVVAVAGEAQREPWGFAVAAAVLIGLALTVWNYRAIRIKLTQDELDFHYGVFNRTVIPIGEIVACEPTTVRFGTYLGLGVRAGTDGSWSYSTSFGPAVRVTRLRGRPMVVSTSNPDRLCEAVREVRERRHAA